MTAPSLAIPRTPRGLISIDGILRVRRAGFRDQRELTCYHGHRQHIGREQRVVEGSISCGHREPPGRTPCTAKLYLFRVRARVVFAMDLTPDEDRMIDLENMDLDEIIAYFGISFHTAEAKSA